MKSAYNNKLAFITGGSEGIGRSIALELVKSGAHVVITSRSLAKLEATLKDLEAVRQSPLQRMGMAAFDLTDFAATQKNFSDLVQKYGVPDFLINCAGYARPGYIDQLGMEHYHGMMDINYFGLAHACKALAPHLIQRGSGTIVNTSSIAGYIGLFGYTGYSASKYAVIGFSEALRRELEIYGIRVSVLCPPNTRTPGLAEENKYKPQEVLKTEEKVKVQDPIDVARAFLKALPKNRFIITTNLDGKMSHLLSRLAPGILNLFVKRPRV